MECFSFTAFSSRLDLSRCTALIQSWMIQMIPECSGKIAGKDTAQSKIQTWFWIRISRKLERLNPLQLGQFAPKSKWHKHHNWYHVFEKFCIFQVSWRIYKIPNQLSHWFLIRHLSFAEISVYKVRFEKCDQSWRKHLVWKPYSQNHISNKINITGEW